MIANIINRPFQTGNYFTLIKVTSMGKQGVKTGEVRN